MSKFVERIVMESKEKYDAVDFSPTAKLPKLDFHFNCAGASVGTLLPFNVFGYYLLYFYTDILGINPLTAANIIIFARVFDTFIRPSDGSFDRQITTSKPVNTVDGYLSRSFLNLSCS